MNGRIVVVMEHVEQGGGTERVVETVMRIFPAAQMVGIKLGRRRHFLVPLATRRFDHSALSAADVVLSFPSSGVALGAPVPASARHVAYFPGPARALYQHTERYLLDYSAPVRKAIVLALPALRAFDARLVAGPDRLLANSTESVRAIDRVYGRRAELLHPPIRTDFYTPGRTERRYFLAVARLVPHKRVDVVVDAFRGVDAELVVAGSGPWLERLRDAAPPNVRFAGFVTDEELRELYRGARALISPAVEEFGMVMAEAHACGTPVIAPRAGGALDIVRDGETGILLDRADAASIRAAVGRATASWRASPELCRTSAERFSEARFAAGLERVVAEELALVRTPRSRPEAPRTAATELARAPGSPP